MDKPIGDIAEKTSISVNDTNVVEIPQLTLRGQDWQAFAAEVLAHIEGYTVPQYGDKGEDLASEYSAEYCVTQVKKYLSRFGRNARDGQDRLDLLKSAHYLQMAAMAIKESE